MRLLRLIPLYMALALGANAALATDAETLGPLREDSLKRLILHKEPKPVEAVEFELEDDGGTASLEDYKGKYILLNFWATWCGPCRAEIPEIERFAKAHPDVRVVGISVDERASTRAVKTMASKLGATYPILHDVEGRASAPYAVRSLPTTFVIDAEGNVHASWVGGIDQKGLEHLVYEQHEGHSH